MATSDNHGLTENRGVSGTFLSSLTRYDLLLAVIPTAFLMSLLVGQLLSLSTQTALAGAAFVGLLSVVDALFVHPPNEPR